MLRYYIVKNGNVVGAARELKWAFWIAGRTGGEVFDRVPMAV
jgi:hypothetical protein